MSPRREPARPIRRIKLRITLEEDGPSLARAGKVLKTSRLRAGELISVSETSDPSQAIKELARVGEALRKAPKDFK